jgi:hypothetical protein
MKCGAGNEGQGTGGEERWKFGARNLRRGAGIKKKRLAIIDADIANVRSFTAKHGCSSQVLLPFQP